MTAPAKLLLRDAFAADLPATVFKRPKMGFALPIGQWLREEVRPMFRDLLDARDSFAQQHLHRGTIERLVAEHPTRQAMPRACSTPAT